MLEVYDFTMWYSSIESWYIRCKFNEKLEFLKQIFDALKNKESMIVWCNILNNNLCDKVFAYFQEV